MNLPEMFYDEIQDAVDREIPFVIPIGTMEYHARHASCGTDTLTVLGCLPGTCGYVLLQGNAGWFAANAPEASMEIGKHMVVYTLEWLHGAIVLSKE